MTEMTDPDWMPIMKRAAAIITDHGGRTSHAAIVSRELGIPAMVAQARPPSVLEDGHEITFPAPRAMNGYIYDGIVKFEVSDLAWKALPQPEPG